jgi:hypothetical protein
VTPRVSYGRCHPALARRSGELGRNQQNAMAITGDIVVDDYSLTFANGKSLAIEP